MNELVVNNYPKSSISEAIRNIKTNLLYSSVDKKIKKILITSSFQGEGKSFISANLATIFATPTTKVLLIDCDMRTEHQYNLFGLENNSVGLSNLLIDTTWNKKIKKYLFATNIENLDILPAGSIPSNPTLLLESKRIEEIINELEKEYDIIIFDTPPVIGLSDTLMLTRLVDATLVVAQVRKTPVEILQDTIASLKSVDAPITGIILNRVKKIKSKYYRNYHINKQ